MKTLSHGNYKISPRNLIDHSLTDHSLVFSYDLKGSPSSVNLSQLETGFSLLITMEKIENILRITNFTLKSSEDLEDLSIPLYDAAIIEIVLEGLKFLFSYAALISSQEIYFLLSPEDAEHLMAFEQPFSSSSSVNTKEGEKISLTISSDPYTKNIFFEKIEDIQLQIRRELWKNQKTDAYLKNYLQNHPKGMLLIFKNITASKIYPSASNILYFSER